MRRIALLALAFGACSPTAPTAPETPAAAPPAAAAAPIYLGVLEDRPGSTTAETNRFMIRVAFQKDGAGWRSLDPKCSDEACLKAGPTAFPKNTDWTIALHGELKGALRAGTPAEWGYYSDIGTQDVPADVRAPTVGERGMDFAGWADKPVYRPLVAVSALNISDPDKWGPAPLSPAAQAGLLQVFHTRFANVQNCKSPEENIPKPITYKDADIAVSNTFASARGWSLATANLKGYTCDGMIYETAYDEQTFALPPDGKAVFLGEGLKLVDAGDYDNDGKSEVVFAINGYNQGGYELRSNDFAGQSRFEVGYH